MGVLADGHVDRAKGIAGQVNEWIEAAKKERENCKIQGIPWKGLIAYIPKEMPLRYDQEERLRNFGIIVFRKYEEFARVKSLHNR